MIFGQIISCFVAQGQYIITRSTSAPSEAEAAKPASRGCQRKRRMQSPLLQVRKRRMLPRCSSTLLPAACTLQATRT